MNSNTPHSPDPNYRSDYDPLWGAFKSRSERLGIEVGNLWEHPDSGPRIRCRLTEAIGSYGQQLPRLGEPLGFAGSVAPGVVADTVWSYRDEIVIDEVDQEDVGGEEPHFVRRMVELWAWGRRHDGFLGVRVVNLRRPHHTWFVAGIEPAADRRSHPELVTGPIPHWMRP